MIKNSPQIPLNDFGGGRNGLPDKDKIKDDEAREQINCHCTPGKFYSAKGDTILGSQISATKFIGGLYHWGDNNITACGGSLYIYTTAWYAFKSGLTDATNYDFLEFYNDLYYGNGADAGGRAVKCLVTSAITAGDATINVDDTGKFGATGTIIIDGDSITYTGVTATSFTGCSGALAHASGTIAIQTSTPATMPKASILEEWASKQWAAGITATTALPTAPWRTYYSVSALATVPENFYDFSSAGSGQEFLKSPITALLKHRNYLLISTTDDIEVIQGFDDGTPPAPIREPYFKENGAVNNKCLITVENDVVYFTGKRLKRLLLQSQTINPDSAFDDPIIDILTNLDTDQSDAAMIYNPTTYKMSLACKSKGASFNDVRLDYDTKYKYWSVRTGQYIKNFDVLNGVTYYGHAIIGEVRKDDESYTYNGAGFTSYRLSKSYYFDDKNKIKDFLFFHIGGNISDNTSLLLKVYIDDVLTNEETIDSTNIDSSVSDVTIGNDVYGNVQFGGGSSDGLLKPFYETYTIGKVGKEISYSVQSSGTGQQWEINSIAVTPRGTKKDYRELAN